MTERRGAASALALAASVLVGACSDAESSSGQGSTGGSSPATYGIGGAVGAAGGTGGASPITGGITTGGAADGGASTGGQPATGGAPASGGATGGLVTGGFATGGTTAGGSAPSGAPSGGSAAGGAPTAGAPPSGGMSLDGGAAATGGVTTTGGIAPLGGAESSGGNLATGGTLEGGSAGAATCPATFHNPIIWEDLADPEVIRVGDRYYYMASSMHFSPGSPILESRDLVNWEYVGHAVPVLDFGPSYDLGDARSYIDGVWHSSIQYRQSDQTFYWMGCMHDVGGGYVYTAPQAAGPWTKHPSQRCYYDLGLLIDDDDTMYVAYGNSTISVAQLSVDGLSEVRSEPVFSAPADVGALEGERFYKIDGDYYILTTQYSNGEYVLRSSDGPFGPYTLREFAVHLSSPIQAEPPVGGAPHQGGLVQTQNGDWYYLAMIDAYPGGRIPVLAPVTWNDGWPSVTLVDGGWGASYPFPDLPCGAGVKPRTGIDTFSEATLGHEWEWNHNPDDTRWSSGAGLTLQTATVTRDLYAARNTLTRRVPGPQSTATIELVHAAMNEGDRAGLALLRQSSAWIGVDRAGGSSRVVMVNDVTMDGSWNTTSTGVEAASAEVSGDRIWLRVSADITPGTGRQAHFSYSTNGSEFVPLGDPFTLDHTWSFFMGYRFAIFNFATSSLGGAVTVNHFELTSP